MEIDEAQERRTANGGFVPRLSTYLLMFSFAISATMLSPMMPEIIAHFNLKLSQGGLILTLQSIGGILVVALAGIVADKVSKSKLMVLGFFLYMICLYLLSIVPLFSFLLVLSFVFGIGSRLVDTLSNAYISDLYPELKGRYLNILHSVFGIGALVGPLYTRFLLDTGYSWRHVFRFLGYFSLPLLIIFYLTQRGRPVIKHKKGSNGEHEHLLKLLRNKQIWVLSLVMFFYVGHQAGLMLWIPMYIETYLKSSAVIASISISIYWIGMIISRMTFSHFTRNHKNSIMIRWTSIIAGLLLLVGFYSKQTWLVIVFLAVSGLLTGAFIPLLIDIASSKYPQNTGSATSILYLSLNTSVMLYPWLIGLIAENISFQWGMIFATISLLVIYFISYTIRDEE
ncbi:MAG: MFS transporter [Halanaerobiales bacterium]